MGDVQFDDESGEGDTMVVERERDLALSAQARQTIADIDAALAAHRRRHLRLLGGVRPADPARAPRGDPVGDRARRGEGRRDRRADDARGVRRCASAARCARRLLIAAVVVARRPADQALGAERARPTATSTSSDRCGSTWRSTTGWRSRRAPGWARSSASSPCSSWSACSCRSGGRRAAVYPFAVGLIVGGAVGNLLDRLFRRPGWLRGGVVDFIDVQWWPIFNVADIAVTRRRRRCCSSARLAAPRPSRRPRRRRCRRRRAGRRRARRPER